MPGALAGLYELIYNSPVVNILEMNPETYRVVADLPITVTGAIRIQGLSGDSDLHAYIYIIMMGMLLVLFFNTLKGGSRFKGLLLTVLLALYITNIFATGSRSAWLGMTICLGMFLLLSRIKRKWFIMSGIVTLYLVLIVGLASFSNTPVLSRLLGLEGKRSITGRLDEAKLDLSMFSSHPILGVGPGNTINVMHRHFKDSPSYPKVLADYKKLSTNGYLILLSENGLVGFTIYLTILFSFMGMMIRIIASTSEGWKKSMAKGLLSIISAHFFLLVFYPVYDSEFWWMTIGMGLAVFNLRESRQYTENYCANTKVPWTGTVPYPQPQQ
jgi:O-antigen ligase